MEGESLLLSLAYFHSGGCSVLIVSVHVQHHQVRLGKHSKSSSPFSVVLEPTRSIMIQFQKGLKHSLKIVDFYQMIIKRIRYAEDEIAIQKN